MEEDTKLKSSKKCEKIMVTLHEYGISLMDAKCTYINYAQWGEKKKITEVINKIIN